VTNLMSRELPAQKLAFHLSRVQSSLEVFKKTYSLVTACLGIVELTDFKAL
jgi:hypothetical protein